MVKRDKFYFSVGVVFLIFVGYLVYILMNSLWVMFSHINPTVGAGLIAATATIIVSVISVLFAKRLEYKAVLLKEHREKKIPIYEQMVQLIFRFAFAEKIGLEPLTEKELISKMAWFTENIVVWGSDDLVIAWNKFRVFSLSNNGLPNHGILFEVENLLLAIRKDLGHGNRGVGRGKILALFINDIDKYL